MTRKQLLDKIMEKVKEMNPDELEEFSILVDIIDVIKIKDAKDRKLFHAEYQKARAAGLERQEIIKKLIDVFKCS